METIIGTVYKLHCNITNEDYYGSTFDYKIRQIGHRKKNTSCSSKQIIDRGNYIFEIIEQWPNCSKEYLRDRELLYIQNFQCINQRTGFCVSNMKEYQKEYSKSEKRKEYEKSEKRKESQKAYRERKKLKESVFG